MTFHKSESINFVRKPHKGYKKRESTIISMKILLGILIRKMCSKRKKCPGKEAELIHSNARKEGGRTLIKKNLAGTEGKLKLHVQPNTLAPSKHIHHRPPPPLPLDYQPRELYWLHGSTLNLPSSSTLPL